MRDCPRLPTPTPGAPEDSARQWAVPVSAIIHNRLCFPACRAAGKVVVVGVVVVRVFFSFKGEEIK